MRNPALVCLEFCWGLEMAARVGALVREMGHAEKSNGPAFIEGPISQLRSGITHPVITAQIPDFMASHDVWRATHA